MNLLHEAYTEASTLLREASLLLRIAIEKALEQRWKQPADQGSFEQHVDTVPFVQYIF